MTETAPNSPIARALVRITPYSRPHRMLGSVTRQNTCSGFAPSVRAASSCAGSICSRVGMSSRTTNGIVTNIVASAMPVLFDCVVWRLCRVVLFWSVFVSFFLECVCVVCGSVFVERVRSVCITCVFGARAFNASPTPKKAPPKKHPPPQNNNHEQPTPHHPRLPKRKAPHPGRRRRR